MADSTSTDSIQTAFLAVFARNQVDETFEEKMRKFLWRLVGVASWPMMTSFFRSLCETAPVFAAASEGFFFGITVPIAVIYLIYRTYEIVKREDVGPNRKLALFMEALGCSAIGGLVGAAIGGCILSGPPGILLGGLFGAIFASLLQITWMTIFPKVSSWMQCTHRDHMMVLGFQDCSTWSFITGARSDNTSTILAILARPQAANASERQTVRQQICQKYRQMAKMKHPDKGGSEKDFVRLQVALEALLVVLDGSPSEGYRILALEGGSAASAK